jgi:hypothetical protein
VLVERISQPLSSAIINNHSGSIAANFKEIRESSAPNGVKRDDIKERHARSEEMKRRGALRV